MKPQNKTRLWSPASSYAYGANAVYIPEYGKKRALEWILVLVQNYPEFKTHPVQDVFHRYVQGAERFENNLEMRVLGWDIRPERRQWSFLYLPTAGHEVRLLAAFSADADGRLRMDLEMNNPSPEARQWEFVLYAAPCTGTALPLEPDWRLLRHECAFRIDGCGMRLRANGIHFRDAAVGDSNHWIHFAFNAESDEDECNSRNRYKKRLKIRTGWVDLPAGGNASATIHFTPDGVADGEPDVFIPAGIELSDLNIQHTRWEALHNQYYSKVLSGGNAMTLLPMPAPQWGRFFLWDSGMTACGAADFDADYAEKIIAVTPDPARIGDGVFQYGAFIITAVYALWELFRINADLAVVERHYDKLKRLVEKMFEPLPGTNCGGLVPARCGTGADDNPAMFYARGEIFTWDYRRTLPVNPEHENKPLICAGLTAHAIREMKILRIFAAQLRKTEDVEAFTMKIDSAEASLNERYWNEHEHCYLDRLSESADCLEIPWIYGFLPLFSGSVPENRRPAMLAALRKYFTPNGWTIVEPASPYYRADGYPNGSAWPPLQYLFWKAFLSSGEMAAARETAECYLKLCADSHRKTLCCWEEYRAGSGRGAGNARFSGFCTPLFAMHRAHREPGAVQTGYETLLTEKRIAPGLECTGIALQSLFFTGSTGFSIVLKPDSGYHLEVDGSSHGNIRTDEHGWCGITFHAQAGKTHILNFYQNKTKPNGGK